jgi:hypothetical protein
MTVWILREFIEVKERHGVHGIPWSVSVFATKDAAELIAEALRSQPSRFVILTEHFLNP